MERLIEEERKEGVGGKNGSEKKEARRREGEKINWRGKEKEERRRE